MSASIELNGVDEMRAALAALPEQFTKEHLGPIVRNSGELLVNDLKAAYNRGGTGTLADRVTMSTPAGSNGLRAKVRSAAPHAHLYELGTVRRFTAGTGANRGTMPAKPTFVPLAIRWRARMMERTKAAMRALRIPGFTGAPEVRES